MTPEIAALLLEVTQLLAEVETACNNQGHWKRRDRVRAVANKIDRVLSPSESSNG